MPLFAANAVLWLALPALLLLGRNAFRLSNVELRAQVEGTSLFAQPRRDRG
ncbi:hypothetical protein [Nocardia sp. NRRL S-836]|uniref:hypothetical protein n=1 Tax=Nocardia sp. NRRL S-836 TaxID=1519492 RepID=UPI000A43D6D9|nr:hypothetical protein [Nocardia sp. NRRL S-836]